MPFSGSSSNNNLGELGWWTIQSKILNNLGYADAAQAYDLVNQTGPDSAIKALQILGQTAEGRMILARNGGDATKAQGIRH